VAEIMKRLLVGTLLISAWLCVEAQGQSEPDNLLTPERVALGKRLFFDPILSRDRSVACVFCHDPGRAYTDGRTVAIGVFGRRGTRNAATLINRRYGVSFFWDGRMPTLEEQVLQPIQDPKEMDLTLGEAVTRLKDHQNYPQLFQSAFGAEVSVEGLSRALAGYLRTILSADAPVDRYATGDSEALSAQAVQGLKIFRGKGNCTACHAGPTYTDERFHNTGVAWREPSATSGQPGRFQDEGRFVVTGKVEESGAFKTPTLREIAWTAPYMHDGSLATLSDVVEFFDRGGNLNPCLDRELRPLRLSADEKRALEVFLLEGLSGNVRDGLRVPGLYDQFVSAVRAFASARMLRAILLF
jgi:cytochrome c peroxidase